jgi:hypothetical protein
MLLKRYLTIVWLLLMAALLISRCTSQVNHVQNMASDVKQSPNLYKRLMAIPSNQDLPYDKNGDLSPDILQNKDINDVSDVTDKLHTAVEIAVPTALSTHVPFMVFIHNTALQHYIQQIDIFYQNCITAIVKLFDHSTTTSNTQQQSQP